MSLPDPKTDRPAITPTPSLESAPIYFAAPCEREAVRSYRPRWWLHWLLFALTAASVLVVGARMQHEFNAGRDPMMLADSDSDTELSPYPILWAFSSLSHLALGVPFAATLLLILFCHEMGHYLYCRHYRIAATPPFFIPFPSMIGTVGAFIKIRAPIETRRKLFDIGIGGPIAGFIPALVFAFVGLALSQPLPLGVEPVLGLPLVFEAVNALLGHGWMPQGLLLHPVALAAWAGMLATSLNLLPVGQLDGGHILFALFPRWHRYVSLLTIAGLVLMAWYFYMGWILWAVLLGFMGTKHPYVEPWPKPSPRRYLLGGVALLLLALSLMPSPVKGVTLPQVWQGVRPTLHEWKMDALHKLGLK